MAGTCILQSSEAQQRFQRYQQGKSRGKTLKAYGAEKLNIGKGCFHGNTRSSALLFKAWVERLRTWTYEGSSKQQNDACVWQNVPGIDENFNSWRKEVKIERMCEPIKFVGIEQLT